MIVLGLLLLVGIHAADYLTFVGMVLEHGLAAEANPIVARIAEEYGIALLTVAKVASVLLMVSTVVIVARHHPRTAAATLSIGILAGSIATLSNLATV